MNNLQLAGIIFGVVWLVGIYPAIYVMARWVFTEPEYDRDRGRNNNRGMSQFYGSLWPYAIALCVIGNLIIWTWDLIKKLRIPDPAKKGQEKRDGTS